MSRLATSLKWIALAGALAFLPTSCADFDGQSTNVVPMTSPPAPSTSAADLEWHCSDAQLDGVVRSVIAGGPGLIAVGSVSGEFLDPAVWVSADGLKWDPVSVDAANKSCDDWMTSVAIGGPGYVAVGSESVAAGTCDAAIWVSEDGMSWRRGSDSGLDASVVQEMWGVTSIGTEVVAVGFSQDGDGVSDMAAWVSPDGNRWDRTNADAVGPTGGWWGSDDREPTVTCGPDGCVALGGVAFGDPAGIWYSPDGREWERITDTSVPDPGNGSLVAVAWTTQGYVALGSRLGEKDLDLMVWLSEDGRTWREILFQMDGDQLAASVVPFGDETVAFGFDADTGTCLVWHSDDGRTWESIQSPAFDHINGVPMVAYSDADQIIVLGCNRPLIGRLPD